MIILNFSHSFTPDQLLQIRALVSQKARLDIVDAPVRLDEQQPSAPQIAAAMESIPLTQYEWRVTAIVVNPPVFAPAAVMIMAWLHGRTGYFPHILWLQEDKVVEISCPQDMRDTARQSR